MPAFNAGALIFRPDKNIYKELKILSNKFHEELFYPEQAILNYFCFINNGWIEIPDLSIMPFTFEILERKNKGMLHIFTPRPNFMYSPIRKGEPTFENMIIWFERCFDVKYPILEIEQEYMSRLYNKMK